MRRFETLRRLESSARTYASTFEAEFASGSGVRMRDQAGREIIDCLACAGALPVGHNHPEVLATLLRFITSDHVQQGVGPDHAGKDRVRAGGVRPAAHPCEVPPEVS
jgi:4-aminobutyrate aminotransferase-like enzyme